MNECWYVNPCLTHSSDQCNDLPSPFVFGRIGQSIFTSGIAVVGIVVFFAGISLLTVAAGMVLSASSSRAQIQIRVTHGTCLTHEEPLLEARSMEKVATRGHASFTHFLNTYFPITIGAQSVEERWGLPWHRWRRHRSAVPAELYWLLPGSWFLTQLVVGAGNCANRIVSVARRWNKSRRKELRRWSKTTCRILIRTIHRQLLCLLIRIPELSFLPDTKT